MQFDWEKFQAAYQQATLTERLFIDSNMIKKLIDHDLPALQQEEKAYLILRTAYVSLSVTNVPKLPENFSLPEEKIETLTNAWIKYRSFDFEDVQDSANKIGQIDSKTRRSVFALAKPVQKYLLTDIKQYQDLYILAEKYSLNTDSDLYQRFCITIYDIILGFYNIADTEPLLIQELGIDPATAQALTQDVLEFLAPLSDPNWQPPAEEGALTAPEVMPSEASPATTKPMEAPANTADTAPGAVESVADTMPQIRTMQSDMQYHNDIAPLPTTDTVYRSEQDSVRGPLADTPQYTDSSPTEEQRWGQ